MTVVHHPELHVEKDVPPEHVPILCGDGEEHPGYGWVEGPAPESWPRDDLGNVIPLETEDDADADAESAPKAKSKSTTKTDKKDGD